MNLSKLLLFVAFLTTSISFSQERYLEVNKIKIKNPNGTTSTENHEVAFLFNKKNKTCSVRIDYKNPQIFTITSEKKDPKTTVKTYELLHKDGRKFTVMIKNNDITFLNHKMGKKYESYIDYSRVEGK
ncbi:hypothetical protein FNW52_13775 [Flavobacterium sp. ZT3R18]|uniref:hypothetical protein n=1 Tax=Flavobacterium sp. ZT3R18 TaxID=2594429 RepID=UPI00117B8491|nr:hypothetical protein [Flavobacterium sp. ZT3R18]TRX34885.1 hypothetical protein FNW52_13775 [Flavobacterium sp. ZT3R18]